MPKVLEGFYIKGRDKRDREVNDKVKTTYKLELVNKEGDKIVIYTEKKWMNDDIDLEFKQPQSIIHDALGGEKNADVRQEACQAP